MSSYLTMSKEELKKEFEIIKSQYEDIKDLGLSLNMARGKPGSENLKISNPILDVLSSDDSFAGEDGIDCRNYGLMSGITEMKKLFGELLGVPADCVVVGGNASLSLMFDTVAQGMVSGLGGEPWIKDEKRKFLCPCPGYDRHFGITEYFGFELINIDMTDEGPDMDAVEEYVKDESVKGIWCVPKYSNPTGVTYSDKTVKRFAALKPAAKDFHIFWDNAYVIHDLYDEGDKLLNLYEECKKTGNENMPVMFTSTSKMSFPGAGVSAIAGSPEVIKMIESRLKYQVISYDKVNQLRHARMYPDVKTLKDYMKKHAEVLRPKFETVSDEFDRTLKGKDIAVWSKPKGGYFINLDLMDGCAKRTAELCKEAGLILTGAGATYPYGKDPLDKNLRIAPSYPETDEIKTAAKLLSVAVRYASLEKLVKQA